MKKAANTQERQLTAIKVASIKTKQSKQPTVNCNPATIAALKEAFKPSILHHSYSMCHLLGIYPT